MTIRSVWISVLMVLCFRHVMHQLWGDAFSALKALLPDEVRRATPPETTFVEESWPGTLNKVVEHNNQVHAAPSSTTTGFVNRYRSSYARRLSFGLIQ